MNRRLVVIAFRCALPVIAMLSTACRERPKVGNGPYADKVAADMPQIEDAVGAKFKSPPKVETRSREQVRDFLLQRMQEPEIRKQLANQEAVYKTLGLIPDTMNLTNLMVKLLTEQIIGFYDPKTKVLYIVSSAPEEYTG
ncbi:MAG TPA: hypothetical protein VH277_18600, partial [Gemmatimonadaceae bacterium]|nr:hypothetical protein [Gemmatimonadaceae bacterium]